MAGRILLDTNANVRAFASHSATIKLIESAEDVFIPSIALGELYYGASHSTRPAENIARIETFARDRTILSCDAATARYFGQIKHQLRQKGRPIPENDLWIAAIAVQHAMPLVSNDAHFQDIEALTLVEIPS